MQLRASRSFPATLALVLLSGLASGTRAEPVVHPPGPLVLPLTGLSIALPKDGRKGHAWSVAASYALDGGFDARDVIDEKLGDTLVSATWVSVGHFSAGGCEATLAELAFGDGETSTQTFFGLPWVVRAGRFDLGEPRGAVPAVGLCAARKDRKTLLLYHLVLDSSKRPQDALKAASTHGVVKSVARAWQEERVSEQPPLARREVRHRGTTKPAREVHFPVSGLTVALPDDGHVWMPRAHALGPPADVDWIDRLAPAMPDLSLEFFALADVSCARFFASVDAPRRDDLRPRDLPEGWLAGPVLAMDGDPEYLACCDLPSGLVAVGLYTLVAPGPLAGSFKPAWALMGALAKAASTGK